MNFGRTATDRATLALGAFTAVVFCLCIPLNAFASIPRAERDALLSLYTSTNGDWWNTHEGWLSLYDKIPAPPGTECDWYGITCRNDHVTEIRLGSNNLVGTLPVNLGNFRRLETLDLSGNRISGRLPLSLWTLSKLQYVNLEDNRIRGSVSYRIASLSALQAANLSYNQLSGSLPESLGRCPSLTEFSAGHNQLTGTIPSALGRARSLAWLSLTANRLTGELPAALGDLRNLQGLDLSSNSLRGAIPATWSRFQELSGLNLSRNHLTGSIPAWLIGLPRMVQIELSHNNMTGSLRMALRGLEKNELQLQYLDVSHNSLAGRLPQRLADLVHLSRLDISHNKLEGQIPRGLLKLPLEDANLSHNMLSGRIPSQGVIPRHTDLSNNNLSGAIPSSLDPDRLEEFSVSHNWLSGAIPDELLVSNARRIDVSFNNLEGTLPSAWKPADDLRVLILAHNRLTGTLPSQLFSTENLIWVDLSSNDFSGVVPHITGAHALQVLRFANNRLLGVLPVGPETTPCLAWLDVDNNLLRTGVGAIAGLMSLKAFAGLINPWEEPIPGRLRALPRIPAPSFVVVESSSLLAPTAKSPEVAVPSSQEERPASEGPMASLEGDKLDVLSKPQEFSITGTVTDSLGGALSGTRVTAVGPTGVKTQTTTDAQGAFLLRVPSTGDYHLRFELSGFKAVVRDLSISIGQMQTLSVVMEVGSITENVSVSSEQLTPRPAFWNNWVSEPGNENDVPPYLTKGRSYQFVLEVGSATPRRANGRSIPISARLRQEISRHLAENRLLPLTVRFFLAGEALAFGTGQNNIAEWRNGNWVYSHRSPSVAVVEIDPRRMVRSPDTPQFEGSLPEENERFGASRLEFDAVEDGCGAITASIWDEAATAPLDQIVQIVSVGPQSHCEDYVGTIGLASDPFGAEPFYARAGAALHVIEFGLEGSPTAVAHLSVKDDAVCPVYSWQLRGSFSGAVFQAKFHEVLGHARSQSTNALYSTVATMLRGALFSGTAAEVKCGPKQALVALQKATLNEDLELSMRVVDSQGRIVYPPLGLISLLKNDDSTAVFSHRILPVQPLPKESQEKTECVDNWAFVLPTQIFEAGQPIDLPPLLESDSAVLRSKDKLVKFMEDLKGDSPVGLVLLAHHADGYLTFENENSVIAVQQLSNAGLAPGSIAVLSACSTAAIADSALLVKALNDGGVNAFIMSPFEIDIDFGAALARNVSLAIVKSRTAQGVLTLGSLYRDALGETEREFAPFGEVAAGHALEFVLAGNPATPICAKTPSAVR